MSCINKTNVEPLKITNNGISLPEESVVLEGVIEDFQTAFDGKLKFRNVNGDFLLSTPQGQLVTSIAAIISDRNRLLAYYVNQIDPSYAVGRMQDAIGRIYFIERRRATFTTVVGRCFGVANTYIYSGTKVKDIQGNVYVSLVDAIIAYKELTDKDGKVIFVDNKAKMESYVDITFQCQVKGSISCLAGTLTERYQVIRGWESVTNLNDGIIGFNDESQAQFEQRRRQSVAGNSVNSVDSIMAALLNLVDDDKNPICQDAYVTENSLGEGVMNGSVSLKPHSIYVCVEALDNQANQQAIAKTIWNKKPPGCAMNGDKTVTIIDKTIDDQGNKLYSTPPQYQITYACAHKIQIKFDVEMARPQFMPDDAVDQIKDAIYDAFTGKDGSQKPRIGGQILASDFYSPVQKKGTWARILSIQIGRDNSDSTSVQMEINEMPSLIKDNIMVRFNG